MSDAAWPGMALIRDAPRERVRELSDGGVEIVPDVYFLSAMNVLFFEFATPYREGYRVIGSRWTLGAHDLTPGCCAPWPRPAGWGVNHVLAPVPRDHGRPRD